MYMSSYWILVKGKKNNPVLHRKISWGLIVVEINEMVRLIDGIDPPGRDFEVHEV